MSRMPKMEMMATVSPPSITLPITRDILNRALPGVSHWCPTAIALREHPHYVGDIYDITVNVETIRFSWRDRKTGNAYRFSYITPARLSAWVSTWDAAMEDGGAGRDSVPELTITLPASSGTSRLVIERGPAKHPYNLKPKEVEETVVLKEQVVEQSMPCRQQEQVIHSQQQEAPSVEGQPVPQLTGTKTTTTTSMLKTTAPRERYCKTKRRFAGISIINKNGEKQVPAHFKDREQQILRGRQHRRKTKTETKTEIKTKTKTKEG